VESGKPDQLALKNGPPPTNSAPAPDFATVEKVAVISCSLPL
jgi:hypothetical protein